MSDDRKSSSQGGRRRPPASARLSELLDQLGPDHAPVGSFQSSKSRQQGQSFGGDLRPVTNILRNPDFGFPTSKNPTRASRPLAMPRMRATGQGTQPPKTPIPHMTPGPQTMRAQASAAFVPAAPVPAAPAPAALAPAMAHSPALAEVSDALPIHAPAPAAAQVVRGTPLPQALPTRRGDVLAVFAARGGVGATTVAINTAASLAAMGNEVIIVDLSLELGDVFVALDLESTTSLSAVARDAARLDGSTLRRRLVRHSSGVWALGQDGHVDDLTGDLPALLPGLLTLLAQHFDYVIIDGLRSFADHAVAALDAADQIHLVLGQDVMSVRRAAKAITLFRRLGYGDDRLHLAVSRASRKSVVTSYEIENALGVRIAATFRDDAKRVQTALDSGALVSQLAVAKGISQDLRDFAANLDASKRQTANRAIDTAEPKPSGIGAFVARLLGKGRR